MTSFDAFINPGYDGFNTPGFDARNGGCVASTALIVTGQDGQGSIRKTDLSDDGNFNFSTGVFAWSSSGHLWRSNTAAGTQQIYDSQGDVIHEVTGLADSEIMYPYCSGGPDGSMICRSFDYSSLTKYQSDWTTELWSITAPVLALGANYSTLKHRSKNRFYFVRSDTGAIVQVDPADGSILDSITNAAALLSAMPGGGVAYRTATNFIVKNAALETVWMRDLTGFDFTIEDATGSASGALYSTGYGSAILKIDRAGHDSTIYFDDHPGTPKNLIVDECGGRLYLGMRGWRCDPAGFYAAFPGTGRFHHSFGLAINNAGIQIYDDGVLSGLPPFQYLDASYCQGGNADWYLFE